MDMKSNASQDVGLNILYIWFSVKTYVSVYLVACGVVANQDLFCCLFQSEAVFSRLVEYQARIALSSLVNTYLFRKTLLLFTRFKLWVRRERLPRK